MSKRNIQTRLLAYFFLLIIIPIATIGISSYYISTDALNQKVNAATLSALEQISKNVDSEVSKIQKYMDLIFTSPRLQQILRQTDLSYKTGDVYAIYYELDPVFSSYFYGDNSIASAVVFDYPGGTYMYKGSAAINDKWREMDWFKETQNMNGSVYWMGSGKNIDTTSNVGYVFSAARVIKDTGYIRDLSVLGLIYISFDEHIFSNIY